VSEAQSPGPSPIGDQDDRGRPRWRHYVLMSQVVDIEMKTPAIRHGDNTSAITPILTIMMIEDSSILASS
jgi:hypothetical protein